MEFYTPSKHRKNTLYEYRLRYACFPLYKDELDSSDWQFKSNRIYIYVTSNQRRDCKVI